MQNNDLEPGSGPGEVKLEILGELDELTERHVEDRMLLVPLEEKDRLALGQDLVATLHGIEQLEEKKKAVSDGYKAEIELKSERVSALTRELHGGVKKQSIQCAVISDYRYGLVTTYRLDTQAKVDSRPMTQAERQTGLKLED